MFLLKHSIRNTHAQTNKREFSPKANYRIMMYNNDFNNFSNIESKLSFNYQINYNKKGEISSLTFYYKLTQSTHNEKFDTDIQKTIDNYIELLKGKIYGSLIIEKYKNIKDSYTYLMFDGNYYKIGRSIDPKKRLNELKVASPKIRFLKQTLYVGEKYFHELFYGSSVGGEWFNLCTDDLEICNILFNAKTQLQAEMLMRFYHRKIKENNKVKTIIKNEAKNAKIYYDTFMNTKLPFGKLKGTKLKDISNSTDIQYLKWFYRLPNIDKVLKTSIYTYLEFIGQI